MPGAFPWNLVRVRWAGYGHTPDADVRRTSLEDGAVRQSRTAALAMTVRAVTVECKLSNEPAVREWIDDFAHDFFTFQDLDGTARQVRVRGGRAGAPLEAVDGPVRLDGERFMRGRWELEGFF